MSEKYNGWTNYETWAVKLWIDNDQSTQEYWNDAAKSAYEAAVDTPSINFKLTGSEPFTTAERAALALAETLKAAHEEELPRPIGFAADLLNAAFSEVNWHEIARNLVDEVVEHAS